MSTKVTETGTHWTFKIFLLILLSPAGSFALSVSFQGGYQSEAWSPGSLNETFSVSLRLRTLQESGLLLLVTGNENNLAVSLEQDGLMAVSVDTPLSSARDSRSIHIGSFYHWRTLQLILNTSVLQILVDGNLSLNHNMTYSFTPQSVSLGGSESFFTPLFKHHHSPHFFIGCMQDVAIGQHHILLNTSLPGLSEGCCIAPRYPAYCLNDTHANLTLPFHSSLSAVSSLQLSFRLQFLNISDGSVLWSQGFATSWLLQLVAGSLQVRVSRLGSVRVLACPGDVADVGVWHQVDLEVAAGFISCSVNGVQTRETISEGLEWPLILLHIGAFHGIGVSVQAFVGCLQRLRVDSTDVAPAVSAATKFEFVDFSTLQLSVSDLLVLSHTRKRLTSTVIRLDLPRDNFRDDLSLLYRQELRRMIHFEVLSQPHLGKIDVGHAEATSFTMHNLVSDEVSEQVGYRHINGTNYTDTVTFSVWVGCENQLFATLSNITVSIKIEESEEETGVASSVPLELAIGTRVPISPQQVLVESRSTSDAFPILFTVENITVVGRANCTGCWPAGILIKDGVQVVLFSQMDVNQGLVEFQHYERFSTATVLVQLSATVLDRTFDVEFEVLPHPGHLYLSSKIQLLYVKQAGMALVQSKHLNVTSTFEDQSPVITYDLLTSPVYGVLQVWEPLSNQWRDLQPLNHTQSLHSLHYFTQEDVQSDYVRYVQADTGTGELSDFLTGGLDEVLFQVRSYNLSGPRVQLSIDTILDLLLLQPSLAISLSPLVVSMENGSAPVTGAVINTSLENMDFIYLDQHPDYEIDIPQLGVLYHLVEAPSYGALELDSVSLSAGDNFTWEDIANHRLSYRHFGTENHQDSFTFYAEASSTAYLPIRAPNLTANLTLVIAITPTNNHRPVVNVLQPITPLEGMAVQVTRKNLDVQDPDMPSEPITIILRKLKKQTPPTGIFMKRNNHGVAVNHFTMADVLRGDIVFQHHLNLSAPLDYLQGIKVRHQLDDYVKEYVRVSAQPLSLSVELALSGNSSCVAQLEAGDSFSLKKSMFNVLLSDHHGNDLNLVDNVQVLVASGDSLGQLYRNSTRSEGLPVTKFLFKDIQSFVYMLGNQSGLHTDDTLQLTFTYGHSTPVNVPLQFCIRPVLLPLEVNVSDMVLDHGRMGFLTSQHISVLSSRPSDDGALLVEIVEQPRIGYFSHTERDDPWGSLTTFTLEDVRAEFIAYNHPRDAAVLSDQFSFRICSENHCLPKRVLNVTVHLLNITVNSSRVSVREGSLYKFTPADFNIEASTIYTSIKLVIPEAPKHGVLSINTSLHPVPANFLSLDDVDNQRLFYNQSVLKEHTRDKFLVRIEAEVEGVTMRTLSFTVEIDIEPVNNRDPEVFSSPNPAELDVVWGGTVLISSSHLSAHDYDSHNPDEDLIWSRTGISQFSSGHLYLDPHQDVSVQNWTEGDIRNNRLHYKHVPDPELGGNTNYFFLEVSDGERKDDTFIIIRIRTIIIVRAEPVIPLEVAEGGSIVINSTYLHFTTEQNTTLQDRDFVITVVELPKEGKLYLGNSELPEGDAITQHLIASNQLVYVHSDSDTIADSFVVDTSVPSRGNERIRSIVRVRIRPINDNAPVAQIYGPLFVVELGGKFEITNRIMSITDSDVRREVDYDEIKCTLVNPLSLGTLSTVRFSHEDDNVNSFTKHDLDHGGLFYEHLYRISVDPDMVSFVITDGVNNQPDIYNLTVIVLPQIVLVSLKQLTVSENEQADITEEELLVSNSYMRRFTGLITVQGSGPLHGQIINSITGRSTRSFTTNDILRKNIYYHHGGDEIREDSFEFNYTILDPAGYNRTSNLLTFHIAISPVDDQPPVVNNNHTFLRLWERETVPLSQAQFNVADLDTPPNKLNFTFSVAQQDSYIAFSNNTTKFIRWFTLADLIAGKVMLVHISGPRGTISYTVMDSLFQAHGTITVIADLLTLDCQTTSWRPIEVSYLSSVFVSNDHLHCTTADDITEREIWYIISTQQLMGHFEVGSNQVRAFNSTALGGNLVRYVHTQTAYWQEEEYVGVNVTSPPALPAHDLPVTIHVQYPPGWNQQDVAVNQGLHLSEGGTQCLNSSLLDARNFRYKIWSQLNLTTVFPGDLTVVYKPKGLPKHGTLTPEQSEFSFTQDDLDSQSVCYNHDDSEMLQDVILLLIEVTFSNGTAVGRSIMVNCTVNVSPVNDQEPVLGGKLQKVLVQNFNSPLQISDLSLSDGDSPPHQLLIRLLSAPSNASVMVNGSVLSAGDFFSQDDIQLGRVLLVPRYNGQDQFQFTYTDGVFISPENRTFELRVESHSLAFVSTSALEYAQNIAGTSISSHHLNTSTNGQASQTVFTLLARPVGMLVMDGQEVTSFTQQDIYDNKVRYAPHVGTQTSSDSFTLSVSNLNLTLPSVNVSVHVLAWGQVSSMTHIDFHFLSSSFPEEQQPAVPLPPDVLDLTELSNDIKSPPTIRIMSGPRFGHLEKHVRLPNDARRRRSSHHQLSSFGYEDLQNNWIVYVWDHWRRLSNTTVQDSIQVLVLAEMYPPGEAVISLNITPPGGLTTTPPPTITSSTVVSISSDQSTISQPETSNSGFPFFTLVPILGVICLLMLLIGVIVCCCLSQQNRKFKPGLGSLHSPHQSPPWSASPNLHTGQLGSYDMDPSGGHLQGEEHNSETSSGFSEPETSVHGSPVRSYAVYQSPLPSVGRQPQLHHRPRMRSNVSITFSSQHSNASEISYEESERTPHNSYCLSHYPPPPSSICTTPVPAAAKHHSHPAFSHSDACCQQQDMAKDHHTSQNLANPQQHKVVLHDAELDSDYTALPDIRDHNLNAIFHALNPVLKKEEYWI